MYTVLFAISRKDGMSHDEFVAYYHDVHKGLGAKLPGLRGYDVFFVDGAADGSPEIDAFTTMEFDSKEAFEAASQSPEMAEAGADAPNFAGAFATYMVTSETVV